MSFGAPREDIPSALRTLNRQLSPAIYRRLQANRTFRECVLLECVRAVLDDDVEMAKGLLRRMTDATLGYGDLAALMEAHPKSLIRMLSRHGNPSARHLIGILSRVAKANGVHFTVQLATDRLV
jgi:DNA-binding phage protein